MTRKVPNGLVIALAAASLSACATPRLHSEAELGSLAEKCGYAMGEVVQDPSEKRLLLVMTAAAVIPNQRHCIFAWARPRHLHVVYATVEQPPVPMTPPSPTEN